MFLFGESGHGKVIKEIVESCENPCMIENKFLNMNDLTQGWSNRLIANLSAPAYDWRMSYAA